MISLIQLMSVHGGTWLIIQFQDGYLEFSNKKTTMVYYNGIYSTTTLVWKKTTNWIDEIKKLYKKLDIPKFIIPFILKYSSTKKTWKNLINLADNIICLCTKHNINSNIKMFPVDHH